MNLWKPKNIKGGKCYYWRIGPLQMWIKKTEDEWLLAYQQSQDELEEVVITDTPTQEKPLDLVWSRLVSHIETDTLQLSPSTPDRPVVVSSESPLKIFPESRALFFVSIPVWVRINIGIDQTSFLTEIPTVILSNTWFGDPMTGELCYSMKTRARRTIKNTRIPPHVASCPVWVKNSATKVLDFEKLCIHVEHLTIYEGLRHLWTNEIYINFLGEDLPNEIDFSNQQPSFEQIERVLSQPRTPYSASVFKKSFSFLKYFTNF